MPDDRLPCFPPFSPDELLRQPVIVIHHIFQLFDLFKPILNIACYVASDDFFLQCFDLQLMLGRKCIITGIWKAQPLKMFCIKNPAFPSKSGI